MSAAKSGDGRKPSRISLRSSRLQDFFRYCGLAIQAPQVACRWRVPLCLRLSRVETEFSRHLPENDPTRFFQILLRRLERQRTGVDRRDAAAARPREPPQKPP